MKHKISASIMCVDNLLDLQTEIKTLEEVGVDYLHLDAMDGHFVNNITFGPDIFNAIQRYSSIPCDYHLMLDNPLPFIQRLDLNNNDIVTVHAEIDSQRFEEVFEYLKTLKKRGVKIGVAINPGTSIESLVKYLDDIDVILVMLINPGFAGQPIIDGILQKPVYIRKYLDSLNHKNIMISVDGGVSVERAKYLSKNGIDMFVGGTSGLFIRNNNIFMNADILRKSIDN